MVEYLSVPFALTNQFATFIGVIGDRQWLEILGLTMLMTLISTTLSALIGMPLGALLANAKFPGSRFLRKLLQTAMSLPPVVAGLLVFLLLSRAGPLGHFQLLFSLPAMVIAQCLLIIPIIASLTCSIIENRQQAVRETLLTLGQPSGYIYLILLAESRQALLTVLLTGFGRAISEVGAVMMVGGNIEGRTRVLTTAIMLETNRGNFDFALLLGAVLMLIALFVNLLVNHFQEDRHGL